MLQSSTTNLFNNPSQPHFTFSANFGYISQSPIIFLARPFLSRLDHCSGLTHLAAFCSSSLLFVSLETVVLLGHVPGWYPEMTVSGMAPEFSNLASVFSTR